jgi:hypothetical protein
MPATRIAATIAAAVRGIRVSCALGRTRRREVLGEAAVSRLQ